MGVRRAVELASEQARAGGPVYTLGPLVHSSRALASLENLGVKAVDDIPQNPENCTIVIRAHGISPAIEKKLRESGCRVVDATCPKVKAIQLKAQELSRAGYSLFLAGDEKHAEIAGILGYAEDGFCSGGIQSPFCVTAASVWEAEKAAIGLSEINKDAKTALLGQTTICAEDYLAIGEAVKKYFPNLEIVQTICDATAGRQQALRELLEQVDSVVIAGGQKSANACRLLAIAKESGKPCVLVESASEIPTVFHRYETVGLCAGASTPDSLIDEIELELYR